MTSWQEGTLQIGAARARWRRRGNGPVLVLLHGFPVAGETWDSVVERLANRFTCLTLDLVGLGGSSSTSDDDYTSEGQARVMRTALGELGISSYALVGNDTGGWIARELALIDRTRVSRLVLTNTEIPRHRPPWIPVYQTLAHWPGTGTLLQFLLRSRAYRRSAMAFGGCFSDLRLLDGEFHERFIRPLIASRARVEQTMHFLRRMKFKRLDEFATLHGKLDMPVLAIWGAEDPTFPLIRARTMMGQFPNVAGFHEVSDAKLFVHEERPAEVAARISQFCTA